MAATSIRRIASAARKWCCWAEINPQKKGHEMAAYQSEERVTYQTLKEWALNSYFDFCRDRGITMGMSHLEVIGYIDYDFEDGFQRPIEDLMWRVILLVLAGGWHSEWHHRTRQIIVDKLVEHDLESLLDNIPADEAETFLHDLKILKLI
ncbi:hypothetical protein MKD49_15670 [Herbaspirillum sp. WGmk3]|nr:hypothetical protein [Herbaspirillum sp. WGmk3]MCO4857927.1 hypothetical protein [Herbaspirillum sp. WGmk3]